MMRSRSWVISACAHRVARSAFRPERVHDAPPRPRVPVDTSGESGWRGRVRGRCSELTWKANDSAMVARECVRAQRSERGRKRERTRARRGRAERTP